jgi:hypothetical protein
MLELERGEFFIELFKEKNVSWIHGVPWGVVMGEIEKKLCDEIIDKGEFASSVVRKYMNCIHGEQNIGWKTEKRGETTFIFVKEVK